MGDSNKLNILLIQPPLPANMRHKKVLPLSLGYIASYLQKNSAGINVEILDALVLNMSYAGVVKEIFRKKRDVVGITFWTAQVPFVYNLAKAIRRENPDTTIIFGGVHTTCCPKEAAKFADYCVLHEGEETFCELLECIRNKKSPHKIKGLAYIKNGEFIQTSPRRFIDNLDDIPFPAWDLLPLERYDTPLHVVGGRRMPIVGSRGCPYNCSFCVSPYMWKQRVRWRSPENVVCEIMELIERYGIRQFHFWDDNLLMNKEYIEGLCTRIIDNRLDIRWVGITKGSYITAHPEIMGLLKESGCIGLEIGIESADPDTFLNIRKEENLRDLEEACRLQKEHGMYPLFTYMSLNPGENITTYYLQAKFIDKILSGLPWYDFFHHLPFAVYVGQFCTPHIGTELHENAENLGMVLAEGWEEYNHHTINFVPNSLLNDVPLKTIEQLRESDYVICTEAAWGWMYELDPREESLSLQMAKRCTFLRFVSEFFSRCNGSMSLKDIAREMSENSDIGFKKSIQYSVLITIVLSQLGVIRSALFNTEIEMRLKTMYIPDYLQVKRKYRFLRLIAPARKTLEGNGHIVNSKGNPARLTTITGSSE